MKLAKIQIQLNEFGTGKLLLDGQDISNAVRGFTIQCKAGEPAKIEIQVLGQLEIDVMADVTTVADHEFRRYAIGKESN